MVSLELQMEDCGVTVTMIKIKTVLITWIFLGEDTLLLLPATVKAFNPFSATLDQFYLPKSTFTKTSPVKRYMSK